MAYCPRCGVHVEDRLDRCPLCDIPIPEAARREPDTPGEYPEDVIPPRSMYRTLSERQKVNLLRALVGFVAILPVVLTVLLDLVRNGRVTWSYFVTVPGVVVAVATWAIWRLRRRPLGIVTTVVLGAILAEILIVLPFDRTVAAAMTGYFVLIGVLIEVGAVVLVSPRRTILGKMILLILAVVAFLIVLEAVIDRGDGEIVLDWSLIVASALLPIAFYGLYLKYAGRKGLNAAAFFLIAVVLMLLGIDGAIDWTVTWSLITTVILVPLAIFTYILHVALFNDTDWRKALHL